MANPESGMLQWPFAPLKSSNQALAGEENSSANCPLPDNLPGIA